MSFALQENDPTTASAHAPSPEIAISPAVRSALPEIPLIAIEEFLSGEIQSTMQSESEAESSALEIVDEEPAVPFQGNQVRSGITFLKDQAACPFRAFAEMRLAAEPIEEADTGLPPKAQGIILHEVLQLFWDEMKSQNAIARKHRRRDAARSCARIFITLCGGSVSTPMNRGSELCWTLKRIVLRTG